MTKKGEQKYKKMLELVDNPNRILGCNDTDARIPRFLAEIGGEKDEDKMLLANLVLVEWSLAVKKVKPIKDPATEFPWLQPSAQNVMIRTLFGRLKKYYNFQYDKSDFCGWTGCLGGALAKLYSQRHKKYVSFLLFFNFSCSQK